MPTFLFNFINIRYSIMNLFLFYFYKSNLISTFITLKFIFFLLNCNAYTMYYDLYSWMYFSLICYLLSDIIIKTSTTLKKQQKYHFLLTFTYENFNLSVKFACIYICFISHVFLLSTNTPLIFRGLDFWFIIISSKSYRFP